MRRLLVFPLLILMAIAVAQTSAPPTVTVDDVLGDIERFDKQGIVAVKGVVSDFVQKTSARGNKYFTFKLKGGKGELNVFSNGEAPAELKNKAEVVATGIFRKTKKLAEFEVKNEIDASPVKGKPNGVKITVPAG
jgi:cytochrome c-type biogenesis protein CcmE